MRGGKKITKRDANDSRSEVLITSETQSPQRKHYGSVMPCDGCDSQLGDALKTIRRGGGCFHASAGFGGWGRGCVAGEVGVGRGPLAGGGGGLQS